MSEDAQEFVEVPTPEEVLTADLMNCQKLLKYYGAKAMDQDVDVRFNNLNVRGIADPGRPPRPRNAGKSAAAEVRSSARARAGAIRLRPVAGRSPRRAEASARRNNFENNHNGSVSPATTDAAGECDVS